MFYQFTKRMFSPSCPLLLVFTVSSGESYREYEPGSALMCDRRRDPGQKLVEVRFWLSEKDNIKEDKPRNRFLRAALESPSLKLLKTNWTKFKATYSELVTAMQ